MNYIYVGWKDDMLGMHDNRSAKAVRSYNPCSWEAEEETEGANLMESKRGQNEPNACG
jgi:hypothetical protein